MTIEFELSDLIPAAPATVYKAWLNSEEHSAMTGGAAAVSDQPGQIFEAWDGYIIGANIELEPPTRILQSWRTVEFDEADPDSLLEITFTPEGPSTRITIHHSNLPAHGMQYHQGWIDSYFTPMKAYFGD